jgi:hypothetical protein
MKTNKAISRQLSALFIFFLNLNSARCASRDGSAGYRFVAAVIPKSAIRIFCVPAPSAVEGCLLAFPFLPSTFHVTLHVPPQFLFSGFCTYFPGR